MGLDMYLEGEKYFSLLKGGVFSQERGRKKKEIYELAYWRKHPNLHGYIVQNFADGKDECQRIWLSKDDIQTIIKAIQEENLPITTGFFFGESDGREKEEDLVIFNEALQWIEAKEEGVDRSIYYQASW
jgi:hypothetical protein